MMIDRIAAEDGRAPEYVLLSDPGHAVIDRYGLLNLDALPDRTVPHPTTYVIDREGVVRWKMTEVDYRVRPENADIMAALGELQH
jgi:peroxiredoxin